MDALDLARWQFGVTTVYHFLFVPLTIGLGVFVAGLQTAWHRTGKEQYLRLTKFFGKLFLINFAMGVVTGIVQEFQFGMNWSDYSIFVGDVFGAPLALEALLAFFLESTFLGLWIFGWDKLPKRIHLATIWAAVIGSNLSAYFILAANAWMKHPVGYEVVDGKARMTDLWAVLTNSAALAQVPHVVGAAFVVAGGFVLAVCGYHVLRERRADPDRTTPVRRGATDMWRTPMRAALVMTAIAGVVVAGSGDMSAKLLYEQQPMKLAAAEGLRHDTAGAPFSPVPGVEVPMLLSFLSTNDPNAVVQGTEDLQARFEKEFGPGDYRPNLPVVFWSFRVMITFGMATVALSVLGLWLTAFGSLVDRKLSSMGTSTPGTG
ncbi:cytochrome ubiquinol oxidase subunit I, partial [Streptosporangium canum]|uniref:cytochrome ubiquinol oxidase subunit I n=1 Tax=Streptosporangium canum TaxID=324952 RepID=UPI00342C5F8C